MRIAALQRLQPGDVLGRSLFNERGELLLASGYTLTEDMIELIERHGFRFVYLFDELTRDILPEEVIDDNLRQASGKKLSDSFRQISSRISIESLSPEEIVGTLEDNERIKEWVPMPVIREQVNTIIEEIVDDHKTVFSSIPMKSDLGRDWQHAFDTTVLAILLAQEFRYDYKELRALGTSSIMHDIGKQVYGKLKDKPQDELSRDEKMLMREHPVYSSMIMRESDDGTYVEQTTVVQHHERYDGRGFPLGIKGHPKPPRKESQITGKYIYRHAEILNVANVYDNYLSGALDGKQYTPEEAIAEIVNRAEEAFHPLVVKALVKVIQKYPVGCPIRIVKTRSGEYQGWSGVVMTANPEDNARPTVLLLHNHRGTPTGPKVVDLITQEDVKLDLML